MTTTSEGERTPKRGADEIGIDKSRCADRPTGEPNKERWRARKQDERDEMKSRESFTRCKAGSRAGTGSLITAFNHRHPHRRLHSPTLDPVSIRHCPCSSTFSTACHACFSHHHHLQRLSSSVQTTALERPPCHLRRHHSSPYPWLRLHQPSGIGLRALVADA